MVVSAIFSENGLKASKVQAPVSHQVFRPRGSPPAGEFRALLEEKTGLKFSNHALTRLSTHQAELDEAKAARLSKAIQTAGKKGVEQSLVFLDELAFLVSVRNKTVITAIDTARLREGVFTQIDGAVIA